MTPPDPLDWNDLAADVPPDVEDDTPAPRTVEPPVRYPPTGDAAAQSERERVLRHPAIAARLCDPPLRYRSPEQWTGYVPSGTWQGRHNDSPQRAALLDIITAAVKADKEAGE